MALLSMKIFVNIIAKTSLIIIFDYLNEAAAFDLTKYLNELLINTHS
jgi:Na+-transporting NADH:ubiquinone oxidoreductase subunit NqrD